jgi:diacylglycerol kinase family enzyme
MARVRSIPSGELPPDLAGCLRILKTGTVRAVDVAEVNSHPFLNNSGLGLYPSLVTLRERREAATLPKRTWNWRSSPCRS